MLGKATLAESFTRPALSPTVRVNPLPSRICRHRTSYRSFVRPGAHVTVDHYCCHALHVAGGGVQLDRQKRCG